MIKWSKADDHAKAFLIKDALRINIQRIERAVGRDPSFLAALGRARQPSVIGQLVSFCKRNGLHGVDYVNVQFIYWPRDGKRALVPHMAHFFGKRAIRWYRTWLQSHVPVNAARPGRESFDRAIRESQATVEAFMRLNPIVYPTEEAVLEVPAIRHMLAECYLVRRGFPTKVA